jgi:Bacterial protein of unknown function (DUF922)
VPLRYSPYSVKRRPVARYYTLVVFPEASRAFRVDASPDKVTWIFARPVAQLDGNQLANTDVAFDIPQAFGLNAHRKYVLTGQFIVIHPVVTYKNGAALTNQLLVHEQGHFDIGMLIARALARDLDQATGNHPGELRNAVTQIRDRHVVQRMAPIQRLYDRETKHGTDSAAQSRWNTDIQAALNQPTIQTFRHHPL